MPEDLKDPVPESSSSTVDGVKNRAAAAASSSVMAIDNDHRMLRYVRTILESVQREAVTCDSAEHALDMLRNGHHVQVVLVSSALADMSIPELLPRIRKAQPQANVVLMAHVREFSGLLPAIRKGVHDILLKPFVPDDLVRLLGGLTSDRPAPAESSGTEISIGPNEFFVFASPAMRELQEHASLVARVNLPVLILGESGTGKEVLARYIHSLSPQADSTFLKVNCAAVPSELLESELFGYEPGAFTGAARAKPGKFRLCNNGTMFLDEIGEMHPSLQAKLLQVLQDGTFSPLGSRTTEMVNVRILAATNIDIKAALATKTFREDLYYRLNGFCVSLPPLRERREDIPVLLRHFLSRYAREMGFSDVQPSFSTRLQKACIRYDWPGNLRELESFVKRYLALGDEHLMIEELAQELSDVIQRVEITPESIRQALQTAGGNRKAAAKSLGISYKVLLHRLRQFGMEP